MHDEPRWRRYLRFWRPNIDADVNDELAFHIDQRVAEFMSAGASRAEAEARARERFGDIALARDELVNIGRRVGRRHGRTQIFDNLRHDFVFAIRSLRRAPGLVIACVVTIALGVGANGAMFSLADRLFARPPSGVREPGALRRLYARTTWTVGEVAEVRSGFPYRVFTLLDSSLVPRVRLAGYTKPDTMPMIADNASVTVHGAYVSSSYMAVLGVRPAFGRFFSADEEVMGAPVNVAVISDRLWTRMFDADPRTIGKTVEINRQRTTIVGIAPRGFDGPDLSATDVWMPLPSHPGSNDGTWYNSYFSGTYLQLVGRVAPGTSNDWISSAATTIVRRTMVDTRRGRPTNALRDSGVVMLAGPILESLAPSITPAPQVAIATRLIGVTIIVLLIACANVASLLLARAMGRRREIAVRIALGISRSRLVAQLLSEGLVLAVAAGFAALLVSEWAANALRVLLMPGTYWAESAVDARVVAFIGLVAIGTGVLAGFVPALQASRPELTDALKSGTREGGSGARRSRLRQMLLVAQVAMSVLLLYGAGLFVHSLMRLRAIDLGFDTERVAYGSVYLVNPQGNFLDWDMTRSPRVTRGLVEAAQKLSGAPGVERVALSTGLPMGGYAMVGLYMKNGDEVPRLNKRDAAWIAATPSYFEVTGTRLARGRFFSDADRGDPHVIVVNETAARTYWPQADAIGRCLKLFAKTAPCSTVIGVVRDSHVEDVVEKPVLQVISPFGYDSSGAPQGARVVVVRARAGQTSAVEALLRQELTRQFPTLAVVVVRSVTETMATELRPWRVGLTLFGGFGVLALIVAALGTYSVLSYAVTQRLHEIGVRIALGARSGDVLRLVVGEGVRLAVIGVGMGIAIAIVASRVMESLLYDTPARDPEVSVGVAVLLVAIAAVASAVPARRAMRVDPVRALKTE